MIRSAPPLSEPSCRARRKEALRASLGPAPALGAAASLDERGLRYAFLTTPEA